MNRMVRTEPFPGLLLPGGDARWHHEPRREAHLVPLPGSLSSSVRTCLRDAGVHALYEHQAAALEALADRRDVLLTTPTGSGKSLPYQVAVLEALARTERGTALCLFPTKALANDQVQALRSLEARLPSAETVGRHGEARNTEHQAGAGARPTPANETSILTYDGDTPAHDRQRARAAARVLVTNPDMLHVGLLPHHPKWRRLLEGLEVVVVDEIHTYRGVFGAHVANVLRRLRRVCRHYGADPRFVMTSATIQNAAEHATRLIERSVEHVQKDASRRAERHVALYNPPVVDRELGLRVPAPREAVRLAQRVLEDDRHAIVFVRSRRMADELHAHLTRQDPRAAHRVRTYRSGHLPGERREVEAELRRGDVNVVFATNALELGLDVGDVDVVITVGYPGSVASLLQQAGRCGRREEAGVALVVLGGDPLDQYLARHPELVFERSPERAITNPDHPSVLLDHLRCAAFEVPFGPGEGFGSADPDLVEGLLAILGETGDVLRRDGTTWWIRDAYPADGLGLRGGGGPLVALVVEDGARATTIGTVDRPSAPWMVHPGAIYLHGGTSYRVRTLNLDEARAVLEPFPTDSVTEAKTRTTFARSGDASRRAVPGGAAFTGDLTVTQEVTGFKTVDLFTREVRSMSPLSMEPTDLLTEGGWIVLAEESVGLLRAQGMWSNDANDYGPTWPTIRDRARLRDGHVCRVCGADEAHGRHEVHHVRPFRSFRSRDEANRLDNLVTLCGACHRRAEAAVRIRSGLAGVAHAVRHLAPLFLMCDGGDIAVMADPASPLADGRPCIVGYDRVPGGIGLARELAARFEDIAAAARDVVDRCGCDDGCPACVGPPGELGESGKREASALLGVLAP